MCVEVQLMNDKVTCGIDGCAFEMLLSLVFHAKSVD